MSLTQKRVIFKSATAVLTYAEMGDVAASSGITLTLPGPMKNCWYRISNVDTDTVTIAYDANSTTLGKNESALFLADGSTKWVMSKGGGAVTKAMIEAVLTGEITSHTHPNPTDMSFADLDDVPTYTGQGGKVVAVNEEETALEYIDAAAGASGSFDYGLLTDETGTSEDYGGLT